MAKRIEKDRKLLTLMILFFPTILIVASTSIQDYVLRAILQILIAFYQLIILKNMLDEYYGTD